MPQTTPIPPAPTQERLSQRSGRGVLITFFVALLFVTNCITALTVYTKISGSTSKSGGTQQITPTPTPSTNPFSTPLTTSTPSVLQTPASPTPTPRSVVFNYNYLDILITYPSDWKLESSKNNTAGEGYAFDCKDPQVLSVYLKNTSECTNNIIVPENLTLSKPAVGEIKIWNAISSTKPCTDCESRTMNILGKPRVFLVSKTSGIVGTTAGTVFEPGDESPWKSYLVSFSTDESHYSQIQQIIESLAFNR